ncbi:MAG: YcbK family protein [Thermodesulfobacteriota bacterium]|nr:YcbK family protein [Thermodesulfobacteriota bacterium]
MQERLYNRRKFLGRSLQLIAGAPLLSPALSLARSLDIRNLSFYHTHTCQSLDITYKISGRYDSTALKKVNHHLQDFRTLETYPIDPNLLDILYTIKQQAGGGVYEVISGYRSPKTNSMLQKKSSGVAKRSLHMKGKAIDIRLTGIKTRELRDIALSLQKGGVGYYQKSDFIHLDTGKVRCW